MKLRIIFVKKKYLLYVLTVIIIMIIIIVVTIKQQISQTFSVINEKQTIKTDLTGDGQEDILYIKKENNNYYVQVNVDNRHFNLEPSIKTNTLGKYYKYWPLRITILDITRDNIPEIFIQGSNKGKAVQNVYTWNNNEFKNIFSNNSNLLGFLDSKSNKTSKFISGNLDRKNYKLSSFICLNNNFEKFDVKNYDTTTGVDSVQRFITYIEDLPSSNTFRPKDIFAPEINGKSIAAIEKLVSDNNRYIFQDGIFSDNRIDKDGNLKEIQWLLSFKGSNDKKYDLSITLRLCETDSDNYIFKINSLILK